MQSKKLNVNRFRTTRINPKAFLVGICLFAFALRLAVMFATSSYRVVEDDTDHFGFGWEMGRVSCSLVEGRGFSAPLPLPTGPTAIVGPIYPLLLASVFKVLGIYSTASAIGIRVLQCMFASLTCLFIYLCGRDSVGSDAGKLAALAWAIFPLNIFFTVNKVWETSLTGMLVAALFWIMLPLRSSTSVSRWISTGALLGMASLVNTSLVVLVIPFGLAALATQRMRGLRVAVAGALACLAVVSPWLVRNRVEFGKFMLRSNFPLEFRVGNNELSYGQKVEALHPSNNLSINRHWQEVGETAFMAEERNLNSQFMSEHLGRFMFSTLNRIANYWTDAWIRPMDGFPNVWPVIVPTAILTLLGFLGVARMIAAGNSVAYMFTGCLLLYPIVYYLTTSQPRFYHSVTPLLILSGTYWVIDCKNRIAALRIAGQKSAVAFRTNLRETV
jgi:hypothetical protein